MMQHLSEEQVAALRDRIGAGYVLTEDQHIEAFASDWTRVYTPKGSCVVLPKSAEQVAEVLRYCHEQDIKVVPSGGRTGLAAACVPTDGEVILSLNRLNQVLQVDTVGSTIVCEAGVTTQAAQEAAAEAGLFFPLDLAAKGSSQLGGNVATNAGGTKFIRYGGARDLVLGMQVVMADGRILEMNHGLRKNNTGYDLKQLFIGSEGTLGVITALTLKLLPQPKHLGLTLMGVSSFADIPRVLEHAYKSGLNMTAFEFFTDEAHAIVLEHADARCPFEERQPYYVLFECEQASNSSSELETWLEQLFNDGLIQDAVLADTQARFHELWSLRELITESLAAGFRVHKNDVSVPVDKLQGYIEALQKLMNEEKAAAAGSEASAIEMILFGHIGDGNLHLNYIAPKSVDQEVFLSRCKQVEQKVFHLLQEHQGSISAEHGIGLLKRDDLHFSRSPVELELMRGIKQLYDPKGILNPGKVLPPPATS